MVPPLVLGGTPATPLSPLAERYGLSQGFMSRNPPCKVSFFLSFFWVTHSHRQSGEPPKAPVASPVSLPCHVDAPPTIGRQAQRHPRLPPSSVPRRNPAPAPGRGSWGRRVHGYLPSKTGSIWRWGRQVCCTTTYYVCNTYIVRSSRQKSKGVVWYCGWGSNIETATRPGHSATHCPPGPALDNTPYQV